jgi:hypothetical protein
MADAVRIDAQKLGNLPLEEAEIEPTLAEVVTNCPKLSRIV